MTLAELRNIVQRKIQDDSYDTGTLNGMINRAVSRVAGTVLLPGLQCSATVYAGKASYTASTISFDATSQQIRDSANGFIKAGFHVGDIITVIGSDNNDGVFTSTDVTAAAITVAETLVDETEGTSISLSNEGPNNIPLPSDFMRNLYACYNTTINRWTKVYRNHNVLMGFFSRPDQTGNILHVAPQGDVNLYYQRIPASAQALVLYYYRKPTVMTADSDSVDGIPEHLQEPLIVNAVCQDIFGEIEENVEGGQPVATSYAQKYQLAIADLVRYIGPEPKWPEGHITNINWDDFV